MDFDRAPSAARQGSGVGGFLGGGGGGEEYCWT